MDSCSLKCNVKFPNNINTDKTKALSKIKLNLSY